MLMNRKIKELLKSLAIILLAANAVFLAYRSGVFNEFLAEAGMPGRLFGYWGKNDFQGNDGNGAYESSGDEVIARPVIMAVVGDIGARCGAKYNQEQLDAMYQKTVNIFGEALGSATMPEECTEDEWRTALNMPGVYWDYQVELPIVSLVKWLGMSALNNNTDYASRFVAVIGERGVDVYYANEEGFYKCASAADADSIGSVMQEFLPNGAYFAFESEEVSGMVAPYTLLMPNISDKYVIEAENLLSREGVRESTAELLGMNILGGASYPEKNGTMVYVGVNGILRIHADGELNYSVTDYDYSGIGEEGNVEDMQLIERAYQLISDIRSNYSGIENVYYSGIEKFENGRVSVNFDYYIDGIRVVPGRGDGAAVDHNREIFEHIRDHLMETTAVFRGCGDPGAAFRDCLFRFRHLFRYVFVHCHLFVHVEHGKIVVDHFDRMDVVDAVSEFAAERVRPFGSIRLIVAVGQDEIEVIRLKRRFPQESADGFGQFAAENRTYDPDRVVREVQVILLHDLRDADGRIRKLLCRVQAVAGGGEIKYHKRFLRSCTVDEFMLY